MQEAGVRATFFVLGKVAEAHPGLAPTIAAAGHDVGTHGYSHESIEKMSNSRFREELHRSVDLLRQQTGQPILGHRAADFSISGRFLNVLESLSEEGLRYNYSSFQSVPPLWRTRRLETSAPYPLRIGQHADRVPVGNDSFGRNKTSRRGRRIFSGCSRTGGRIWRCGQWRNRVSLQPAICILTN